MKNISIVKFKGRMALSKKYCILVAAPATVLRKRFALSAPIALWGCSLDAERLAQKQNINEGVIL